MIPPGRNTPQERMQRVTEHTEWPSDLDEGGEIPPAAGARSMDERPTIESLVFQGCSVHRGHNVKLCVGCLDASLYRLARAVEAVVQVLEERLDVSSEAIENALEEG